MENIKKVNTTNAVDNNNTTQQGDSKVITPLNVTNLIPQRVPLGAKTQRAWIFVGAKLGKPNESKTVFGETLFDMEVFYRFCINDKLRDGKLKPFNGLSPRNTNEARMLALPIALRDFLRLVKCYDVATLRQWHIAIFTSSAEFTAEIIARVNDPQSEANWQSVFWCSNPGRLLRECAKVDLVLVNKADSQIIAENANCQIKHPELEIVSPVAPKEETTDGPTNVGEESNGVPDW
jgi:hypothetical protein